MDHMVKVYFVLQKTVEMSPKMTEPFCIPTSNDESSYCSTSSPKFGVVSVLDFGRSNRCVVVTHSCFNLQFSNDDELLFKCLVTIYISSLVRGLLRVFPIF